MVEVHRHRPTLKQTNKSFKSKHATKSSLKEAAKAQGLHVQGKIARASPKSSPSASTAAQSKLNRRNNAKQNQTKKRNALVSATRIFNGVDGAPRIVAVIPLSPDANPRSAVCALAESLDVSPDDCPEAGLWKLKADRFKTSLQFINVPYKNMYAALDACKAADYVVFVLSASVEVEEWGDSLLRILQAQGLPDVVTVVSADTSSLLDAKSRPGVIKSLLSFIQYFVPSQGKIFDLHASADRLNAVRAIAEGKPGEVRWREGRAWLLGETVEWAEGVLSVTGVIVSAPLPRSSKAGMDVEPSLLAEPDANDADSLVSSNDPDDLANEQTWPTEEEMRDMAPIADGELPDAATGTTPKTVRRIPKGMSEYQAAWIIDEEEDEGADEGDAEAEGGAGSEAEMEPEEMVDMPMEDEDMATDRRSVAFQDLDAEEEEKQLTSWRNRSREEEDDLAFPDELDTPKDVPARTRFQRYRGMRSFRTSPWDTYENLPRDYARIFQFEDFRRTERGVRRRAEQEAGTVAVEPGVRVTLHLQGVPQEAANVRIGSPFVAFALLQHEHKKTVLNFTVQRNTEYEGSVRSKDPLILCVGPRRLRVNPIYSQHTRGGGKGTNNVHKFERFLRHGVTSVATTYGPVVFGKQPCVLLRESSDLQAPYVVAMGTFMNPDTTRVIAKRIILTGHPFKVHKKTATVRYMFFNSDDVHYFKPIQLHTKLGRTGHIRESLGTHGYLKAHFDGPVNQMDTVCMALYKRVFPKWAELWKEEGGIIDHNAAAGGDAMEE
ncbi:hypothetical protein HWV62_19079 [Athelia sp. TMB]|nr:hypothetical protein HWV62_19079 [Athelia sp. TMB]